MIYDWHGNNVFLINLKLFYNIIRYDNIILYTVKMFPQNVIKIYALTQIYIKVMPL